MSWSITTTPFQANSPPSHESLSVERQASVCPRVQKRALAKQNQPPANPPLICQSWRVLSPVKFELGRRRRKKLPESSNRSRTRLQQKKIFRQHLEGGMCHDLRLLGIGSGNSKQQEKADSRRVPIQLPRPGSTARIDFQSSFSIWHFF